MNDKPQPRVIPNERIEEWIAEDEAAAAKLGLKHARTQPTAKDSTKVQGRGQSIFEK